MRYLAGAFVIALIAIVVVIVGKGVVPTFWQFLTTFFILFFPTFVLLKISFFLSDTFFPIADDRNKKT